MTRSDQVLADCRPDPVPPIVLRYIEAYNARDIEKMMACLSPDIRFVNCSGAEVTAQTEGAAAFRELAEAGCAAFSERRQSVLNCISQGPRVALRIAFAATVAADLPNGWVKGQRIEMLGATFIEMKGGLIRELIDHA